MLICGSSGSGKTTLVYKIINYLNKMNKHIFVFDLKGDMQILDENDNLIGNYINFTAWNSEFGINPFEFDYGVTEEELRYLIKEPNVMDSSTRFKIQNSGPKVQIERIIEMFKKTFMPNLGPAQRDALYYLLFDTYLINGIEYNNIKTWLNSLPSLNDTVTLIEQIKEYTQEGESRVSSLALELIAALDTEIDNLKKGTITRDSLQEKVEKKVQNYIETKSNDSETLSASARWFAERKIDSTKYASKDMTRTIEKLGAYIRALADTGVFHSNRPPVKNGLNIINISGQDIAIQRFIVDIWLGKVFRSCKIRGTYADLPNKKRGEKCDTIVIVDESKLIAGNAREKNDPYSYLNRIATEARGFGLGLIVASQSAEHFPPEFLKNFESQIILSTGIADFEAVRKSFGIDKAMLEYTQMGFGRILVKTGRVFSKVSQESTV